MRLKTFKAKTMPEAIKQVKKTLGDDAIIVTTREEPDGGIRVTAAVEHDVFQPPPPKTATPTKNIKTTDKNLFSQEKWIKDFTPPEENLDDSTAEFLTDVLLKHHVPNTVSDQLISSLLTMDFKDSKTALVSALKSNFKFMPLPQKKHANPIILVGPPGGGKTLVVAKLAARAVMSGLKPAVISTDTIRAGAMEQLQSFLDILSIPLNIVDDAPQLKKAIKKNIEADQIIIDTGGINPFDPKEMKELAKLLRADEMDSVLVLPAGGDADETAEMALTFSMLGVKSLLPTRLDFARRIGGILTAANRAGLSFADASHTSQVANGLIEMSPETLADLLISGSSNKK